MKIKILFLVFFLLFISDCIFPQLVLQVFKKEMNVSIEIDYLLYLPEGYDTSNEDWPLMLFLHGAGERGSDINYVKRNGPPKLIEEGKQFPFIIVSPQCPELVQWNNQTLIELINFIEQNYRVDKNRIYLTGLSMGGHATWALSIQFPERFAAVAPVCGRGYSQDAYVLKDLPVWIFHGEKDDIIPVTDAYKIYKALQNVNAPVKLTIYPEAGHDAWTETYNNPDLYEWLLNHNKISHK